MSSINSIKAIIILGLDGSRGMAQYYDDQLTATAKQFERRLFSKTKTPSAKDDIIVLEGVLVVHKYIREVHIYVVGGRNENPLLLDSVLRCLVAVVDKTETSSSGYRSRVIVALDEMCDSGMVLETDADEVLKRLESQVQDDTDSIAQKAASFAGFIFGS